MACVLGGICCGPTRVAFQPTLANSSIAFARNKFPTSLLDRAEAVQFRRLGKHFELQKPVHFSSYRKREFPFSGLYFHVS
jgi:hypothetical protein